MAQSMYSDEAQKIITPIIHINGDKREVLVASLKTLYNALRATKDALRACAPNNRNFYPIPGRMALALAQHWERREHVTALIASVSAEMLQLDDDRSS